MLSSLTGGSSEPGYGSLLSQQEQDTLKQRLYKQWAIIGAVCTGVLTLTLVFALLPHSNPFGQGPRVSFVVFGDFGRQGAFLLGQEKQRDGAARQVAFAPVLGRVAASTRAQFIVSVGDNFYDNGLADINDTQFLTSFSRVYDAALPGLNVPFYPILGNTDYVGDPGAQMDPALTAKDPRWRMPSLVPRNGVLSVRDGPVSVDLIFIDTTPFLNEYRAMPDPAGRAFRSGRYGDDLPPVFDSYDFMAYGCPYVTTATGAACFKLSLQRAVADLDAKLAASTAAYKVVFGHHPIRSAGHHGDNQELLDAIDPILHRYGVAAYINGHDHDLQHIARPDCCAPGDAAGPVYAAMGGRPMHYVTSGAGSSLSDAGTPSKYAEFRLQDNGCIAVNARPDALEIQFYSGAGAMVHSFRVPADPPRGPRGPP